MLTIWGRASSVNVQKTMWLVGELGLAHRRIDAGGRYSRLDSPEYRELNPHRRVPTLVDGDVVVWESNAILRYLAARYGEPTLWDADPGKRARADQWMDWMQTTLAPDFYALFWAVVRTRTSERDPDKIARSTEALETHYRLVEAELGTKPFLLGKSLSLADIAIGVTFYRYFTMEISRARDLPRLARWYARLQDRPAYREHVMVSYEELRA